MFFGAGQHGTAAESLLSLDVVRASGESGVIIYGGLIARAAPHYTLTGKMVKETIELAETDPVAQWPVWPLQCFLFAAFGLGALRHLLYGLYPTLRPPASGGENAPPTQEQADAFARSGAAPR